MTVAALLDRLHGVRPTPMGWAARCPAHDDRSPSLSIRVGDGGRILLHDFRGCSFREIMNALGLTARDLAPRAAPPSTAPGRRPAPGPFVQGERWETVHHLWRLSDAIRRGQRFAAAARRVACQVGESERAWSLLEAAAGQERLVLCAEAELDDLLCGRIT